ncbi:MAG: hypothetical protein BGO51_07190 [Rhodospirillales bacterium 69-11]|nr:DUF29 domain-containing protein [Rhodospirillales bacterium]MBN8927700.1 DUF29 domain-containing protein [Rhodospirillales bacterium]OJW24097.1 MAG: hypothetical protein BGO51_07190 [Rhodospirillales bacterium 69-11]
MSGYEEDLLVWSERQSALLRRMAAGERVNDQIDWENVAEEVDASGKSARRELRNRVAAILLHLMKLQASPAPGPRAGWRETVRVQRRALARVLEDSPSLRGELEVVVAQELPNARQDAASALADHGERPRVAPETLAYGVAEVTGDWWPGADT